MPPLRPRNQILQRIPHTDDLYFPVSAVALRQLGPFNASNLSTEFPFPRSFGMKPLAGIREGLCPCPKNVPKADRIRSALEVGMKDSFRGQYTLEFQARGSSALVRGGEGSLRWQEPGDSGQTLQMGEADAAGGCAMSPADNHAEQMEIARLKSGTGQNATERTSKKRAGILRGIRGEIRLYSSDIAKSGQWRACRALELSASGFHQYRAGQTEEAGSFKAGRRIGDTACWFTSRRFSMRVRAPICHVSGGSFWRAALGGKERVAQVMKAHGFQARGKRKFKATTNSSHRFRFAEPAGERLLRRSADRVWTGDHPICGTEERLGLSRGCHRSVQRQVVGFSMTSA